MKFFLIFLILLIGCGKKKVEPAPAANTAPLVISGGFIYQQQISKIVPANTVTTHINCTAYFFNPAINPNATYSVTYSDVVRNIPNLYT